jgi:class 3 adenylate cyclase
MARHQRSIELIILAPVLVFFILAGAGLYFLILNSVQEFAAETIRQGFQSMFDGIHSIADRKVDQLNRVGQATNERLVRIRQVSALIEMEDYARKNEVGIVIYAENKSGAVLVAGISETVTRVVTKASNLKQRLISLSEGDRYYADSFKFAPWGWHFTLLKEGAAYDALISKSRYFYVASGIALLLISVFLIVYLRRMIARPIHLIVERFRSGETPDYSGIREYEFLSDSIAQMMQEVADNRDHLEEQVSERTTELEGKNQMLESLSSQLSKYLSPQVYASIFSGTQSVELASTRKKLTVFFSDIAGFTETADKLESEELTQLLNHYLTEMSQIALEHGGTIDKYVGDAILIFFGDPETKGVKEDALACVEMSLAMRKRMWELATIWRESGIEKPLHCRMGINSGYCTVGNFGSEDRMDYTIIGGGVNLASRLETEATPDEILISYETYAHVKDRILCKEHGEVTVKGIAYPVATYQVVDAHEAVEQQRRHFREEHPNMILDLDFDSMTSNDRDQALKVLRRAQVLLSRYNEPDHALSAAENELEVRDALD